jgi:hypothetical protein
MKIYGIDFTSTPSRQKSITCVAGEFIDGNLHIDNFTKIASLNEFEVFLKRRGPWLAGFDFPFGQPKKLIDNLGWPKSWEGYVAEIAKMNQHEFEETLTGYRASRPTGDKHHKRVTDIKANSISPMSLHGIPIGKMFFRGAPRLLRADLNILPCRPKDDDRTAVEAYPALVARKWLARRSYKSDDNQKQTAAQQAARHELVDCLRSDQLQHYYGLSITLELTLADQFVQDPTADSLDACLCAIQAAWAYSQRDKNFGIPAGCDPCEGWIVDPEMI